MGYYSVSNNLSMAWLDATRYILSQPGAKINNLMIEISNPLSVDNNIESSYKEFCVNNGIKKFLVPAQTIFPKKVYDISNNDRQKLYRRSPRLYKHLKGSWGYYFDQMINWKVRGSNLPPVNQLENIIKMINERQRVYSAAYTIQITNPKDHTSRTRGGPCLHYILLQLESNPRTINMAAIYRNHDFAIKAYGNYVGLGHLLQFLCNETNFQVGKLTCISSCAFIGSGYRAELRELSRRILRDAV